MAELSPAFEKTYQIYLERIGRLAFKSLEKNLGVTVEKDEVIVPFIGKPYRVSAKGILDPAGQRPSLEICVVLSNYLIWCQDDYSIGDEWVSYRDFKDAGPLTVFYANSVEKPIARHFSGKLHELETSCLSCGGVASELEVSYELSIKFNPLPKVPMLLLFNDVDEEFPAHCSLLFEKHADKFLDAESLAILGMILSTYLRKKR
jgi:hypothetical protein